MSAAKLLSGEQLIDCTQTIEPSAFTFVGCFPGSTFTEEAMFKDQGIIDTRKEPAGFKKCVYKMACDVGTHIDSPAHWFEGMRGISELTLEELTAPGVVIDVTEQVEANPDYLLSVADLKRWESEHGSIPTKALVCMKTGWSRKFADHSTYMGLDEEKKSMHFPGFSPELAKHLIDNCDIVGIGIDTASLDCGMTKEYEVHQIVLGANKYQIENMVLEEVPEAGVVFVSLPLKVKNGPEAETRVMAIVQKK